MRLRNIALAGVVALTMSSAVQAYGTQFVTNSGFGNLSSLNSCKSGIGSGFHTGPIQSTFSGDCVGYFDISIDTDAQTITLTGREHGNYESSYLEISTIYAVPITSLHTVSYTGLFDPDYYGDSGTYGGIPVPLLSFTSDSIRIAFTTFGGVIPQFTFDGDGGTAVFAYNAAPIPEPETYAMLLAGLGLLGLTARRRRQKLNA